MGYSKASFEEIDKLKEKIDIFRWEPVFQGHFMLSAKDQDFWSYLDFVEYKVACLIQSMEGWVNSQKKKNG